jgi:parallel beta-helix repeat protein
MFRQLSSKCAQRFLITSLIVLISHDSGAAVYYVRQTVGDDANDGLTPRTAWRQLAKLSTLKPGDTAYVGPGLYREEIELKNDGSPDARITLIADNAGKYTGDPPGRVILAGSDPVDGNSFRPTSSAGVYSLSNTGFPILGAVEMDSPQIRYHPASSTREHIVDKLTELQVVEKLPSHFEYGEGSKTLYIHTSDGKPPATHEIELIRRGFGIYLPGKHSVTVIGFTFRHMSDAGISFFKGAGDGAALFNTSYGSRQGIRVYTATNILVYGNTLFRNENCGVYFASSSTNGSAIRNVTYENVKGIRWGSKSVNGVALENFAFDNFEAGISLEDVKAATVRGNRIGNNRQTQLLVFDAEYRSDENCFERSGPDQSIAHFIPWPREQLFKTLREYMETQHQDVGSRENGCGAWPEKLDVHKMHSESLAYRERALKILESRTDERPGRGATPPVPTQTPAGSRNTPPRPAVARERIRTPRAAKSAPESAVKLLR